jgi:hypothetical protein
MSKRILSVVVPVALAVWACHTITDELPTEPTPDDDGVIVVPIPKIPLPTPKPTPTPRPTPTPSPGPTPTPPPKGQCGDPLPTVSRMNCKVHLKGSNRWTLDSTPIVGPDREYCRKVGFTDGRSYCAVRPEGAPDREACETYAIGKAKDTGRPGPTWYRNGKLCTGEASGCENHDENQYLLYAYAGGVYEPCTKDDVCGQVDVDK